ncbi:MAG: ankyrin repeat domain-containing protein [Campylobacteraceae bacterium]|nr:ankyrin repeat domain-containing protein [Campylobacteraceae bacterium]
MFRVIITILFLISFSNANSLCQTLKTDANSIFSGTISQEKYLELTSDDFSCENSFLKPLYDISLKIRGVNIDCDGNSAITYKREFKFLLLKALYAPEIYKKTLDGQAASDAKVNKNREYFQVWALQSLDNYLKFEEFNSHYQVVVPMLVDFYILQFGYDEASAIFYANRVANEFLNVAVGEHKNRFNISELDRNMLNVKFDTNLLIGYLYEKRPNEAELTRALKTAILLNKEIDFLDALVTWGANLNSGHESVLLYSLKNLAMFKYLLSKGADVNYKNSFGKTALFYAVEFRDENLVNLLIENGADVNAKIISSMEKITISSVSSAYLPFSLCGLNHTSKSVLMHAAKYSNLSIIKTLIKNGARIDEVDDMGFNLADWAALNEDKKVLEYFHSLGLKEQDFTKEQYE